MPVGFLGVNLNCIPFNSVYYSFTSYRITYYYLVLIDQYEVRKSTTLRPIQVSARGWRPTPSRGDQMTSRRLNTNTGKRRVVTN